jgi:hypothetical protein
VLSGPNAWTLSKLPPPSPSPSLYRHRFKLLTVRGQFCALRNGNGGCTERRFWARQGGRAMRHYACLPVGRFGWRSNGSRSVSGRRPSQLAPRCENLHRAGSTGRLLVAPLPDLSRHRKRFPAVEPNLRQMNRLVPSAALAGSLVAIHNIWSSSWNIDVRTRSRVGRAP